jgi:hypothetical protein
MVEGRIVIIPFLQGKRNFDGTITEPDVEAIFERWLGRTCRTCLTRRTCRTCRTAAL